MSTVIEVDFKNKRKIERYVITAWKCFICKNAFKNDSREPEKNTPRIVLREGTSQRAEECICKNCSLDIKQTAESLNWSYDE